MLSEDDARQFNQANEAHAANYTAIVIALVKKGLLTYEEYEEARLEAVHLAEQEWARKRDDVQEAVQDIFDSFGDIALFGDQGNDT